MASKMTRTFSARSLKNLRGVHPHLIAIACTALRNSLVDFVVVEGLRSAKRQRYLYDSGRSKLKTGSAHLAGYAIDCYPIVNGDVIVDKIPPFIDMAKGFISTVASHSAIRWGGDWDRDGDWKDERFFDGCHFELDRPRYDWTAPHPASNRRDWTRDDAALLRFDDPDLCPLVFSDDAPEPVASPLQRILRRLGGPCSR